MKDFKAIRIFMIIMCFAILFAATFALIHIINTTLRHDMFLRINDDEFVGTAHVDVDCLIPGTSTDYTLYVGTDVPADYDCKFKFVDTSNTPESIYALINVTVTVEDKNVFDGTMADLMGEKDFTFSAYLSYFKREKIVMTFSVPETVGNEFQGYDITFDCQLVFDFDQL